jgi:succinate dehydrogenase/fumarate reductase flavoprotein subunit
MVNASAEPFNVLIVGGGVAGLEAVLALRAPYLEEHDRLARSNT